ncbi:hypothetical protein MYP_1617 [Sporocytophaga myxococcoides]|uniref:DUF2383 domain-containing protein n=1 Tax=Sporocytophaga myxococcoides TaxID=153721 RepID=A0A098LD94_9BACT|nr:hypothetical protein [Sporocytophaga myxococcoides]GAL84389.1 hypothetical protein MYP_1617 [Sporocytophaga myxococcoides]
MKNKAVNSVNALNEILSSRQEAYRKAFSLTLARPVHELMHNHFRKSLILKEELNKIQGSTNIEDRFEISFSKNIWSDLGSAIENGGINKEQTVFDAFVQAEEGTIEDIAEIIENSPDADENSKAVLLRIKKEVSDDLKEIKSLWISE